MPAHPIRTTTPACECGGIMRWVQYRRWRAECGCGRCGPWRAAPETAPCRPGDPCSGTPVWEGLEREQEN